MRHLLLFAALAALAACTSPPPPIPRHDLSALSAPSEAWEIDLPADLRQVRLHAQPDALFVTAYAGQGAEARRVTLCLDLGAGQPRWLHEVADPGQQEVEIFFTRELILLVDRAQALALRRADGQVAWLHRDQDSRPIYAAFAEGDDLVLSLNNQTLLWLDARDGRPRGRVALQGEALKQVARVGEGLVALLIRAQPQPEALGVPLVAAAEPGAEAPLAPAWSAPIQSWSAPAFAVAQVFLSRFEEDTWSALDASTGALLWRASDAALPGRLLLTPEGAWLARAGQAPPPGEAPPPSALLRVDPRQTPGSAPRWTLALPSHLDVLGLEPSPQPGLALGATADTFFVFDPEQGRLRWVYAFQQGREPGPWANASANGEALFLYFEGIGGAGGRLKRVPVLLEATR